MGVALPTAFSRQSDTHLFDRRLFVGREQRQAEREQEIVEQVLDEWVRAGFDRPDWTGRYVIATLDFNNCRSRSLAGAG